MGSASVSALVPLPPPSPSPSLSPPRPGPTPTRPPRRPPPALRPDCTGRFHGPGRAPASRGHSPTSCPRRRAPAQRRPRCRAAPPTIPPRGRRSRAFPDDRTPRTTANRGGGRASGTGRAVRGTGGTAESGPRRRRCTPARRTGHGDPPPASAHSVRSVSGRVGWRRFRPDGGPHRAPPAPGWWRRPGVRPSSSEITTLDHTGWAPGTVPRPSSARGEPRRADRVGGAALRRGAPETGILRPPHPPPFGA